MASGFAVLSPIQTDNNKEIGIDQYNAAATNNEVPIPESAATITENSPLRAKFGGIQPIITVEEATSSRPAADLAATKQYMVPEVKTTKGFMSNFKNIMGQTVDAKLKANTTQFASPSARPQK